MSFGKGLQIDLDEIMLRLTHEDSTTGLGLFCDLVPGHG